MAHAADPSRGDYDDPLATPTYVIGIVGTIILIATVIMVQTLSHEVLDYQGEKMSVRDYLEITELQKKQTAELEGYTWTFPEEDRVSIPIGEGVQKVLETYGRGQ